MKNILFINSVEKSCGVHSYGERTISILNKSVKYNFIYSEISSFEQYSKLVAEQKPSGIIYNYHPLTMSWFAECNIQNTKHYLIHHEGTEHGNLKPDYYLYVDSLFPEDEKRYSLPRPLLENIGYKKTNNSAPVITSFGFGFGDKNFGAVVKMVNDQFDKAVIRLHIPRAYYGDRDGEATNRILPGILIEMKKPDIEIQITHDFLSDSELIKLLSESSVNLFLYDKMQGRGLSSVIDYCLSVDVPIAINDSYMFRGIQCTEINVSNKTLPEIIEQGTEPLEKYKRLWSNDNFIKKYESILDSTL